MIMQIEYNGAYYLVNLEFEKSTILELLESMPGYEVVRYFRG